MSSDSSTDELLLVIVDATRGAWSALDATARSLAAPPASSSSSSSSSASAAAPPPAAAAAGTSFPEFLLALELFLAAFACSSRRSRLAVLAYNGREGGFLYPPLDGAAGGGGGVDDLLRPAVIKRYVRAGLLRLRYGAPGEGGGGGELHDADGTGSGAGAGGVPDLLAAATAAAEAAAAAGGPDNDPAGAAPEAPEAAAAAAAARSLDARTPTLGSCLALALCFAGRQRREGAAAGRQLPARLCVFQASADVPAHYVGVVNAVYSALRMGVPVDSCAVGGLPSVFLQQAAYLTQGLHVAPDAAAAAAHFPNLLQFLVSLLLPSRRARETELLLPLRRNVNLRAHCFCHQRHKSLAWLCYVCLSVWCRESEQCATCGTRMAKPTLAGAAGAE